ncbi:MAG: amidohydrolase, partial [Mycobacterium sp.]
FSPFDHLPKDQATVGALRKAAEGHDVEIRALSHERTGEKTSFADFAANATAVSGAR